MNKRKLFLTFVNLFFFSILINKNRFEKNSIIELNKSNNFDIINNKIRKLLTVNETQKLNKIINIYNPYNNLSFISSTKNENGDLFIFTNSENKTENTRLIYRLKSDGSNYFINNESSYRTMTINLEAYNIYPMVTSLNIKDEEFLISISQEGNFESFNYKNGFATSQYANSAFRFSSNIYKNSFTNLKYYNNSNYILSSFISKKNKYNYLVLQIIIFNHGDFTIKKPKNYIEKWPDKGLIGTSSTCFEIEEFVECLYTNSEGLYTISLFDILNLDNVYNKTLEQNKVNDTGLFSKCIYFKNYIGAFIYYISNNKSPILVFQKLSFSLASQEYRLDNYFNPITINSKNIYSLGNSYIYNDIITINENTLIYLSISDDKEIIIIIMIKLLNKDQNILLNYYKIELKNDYNIKIYKDINIFTLKDLLGVGMTNYNYNLNENKIYSNYFIIGISSSDNFTISDKIDIFDEDNIYELKIKDLNINIYNNIFGYFVYGIRIISQINDNLGFYLKSNYSNKTIESNQTISINDSIIFKVYEDLSVKKGSYSIIYESVISEPNYNDLLSFSNSIEFFPSNDNNFEEFYKPSILYGKIAYINFSIRSCYKTCLTCSFYGNHINHYCETCQENYIMNITDNSSNCYPLFNEETNLNNENISTEIFSEDLSNENSEKNKIIKQCEIQDFFNKTCSIDDKYLNSKDKLINDIKESITNHSIDELLDKVIKNNEDLTLIEGNTIYQITSSSNQNNKIYYNVSTIRLGECEQILKYKNNISEEESLILFKIDYFIEGYHIPFINYEVYNPQTKQKLDLNVCKDEKIDIYSPVSIDIDESKLFKYNQSSEYFNDICSPYTTEDETDITLSDRRNEFLNNNLSICENNCVLKDYYSKFHIANCKCDIKTDLLKLSELEIDLKKLRNNFIDFKNIMNLNLMKCYYILFTKEGLLKNIGCYIVFIIIILYTISSIIFCTKGHKKLLKIIKIIVNSKNNKKEKIIKTEIKKVKIKKKKNNNKKIKKISNPNKRKNNIYKTEIFCSPNNESSQIKLEKNQTLDKKGKFLKHKLTIFPNKNLHDQKQFSKKNKININFNDYELNNLMYEEALKYDNRTYFQYYWSLLKTRHPIFFTFIPSNDYNSISIKICLFLFSFVLYCITSLLFFSDEKMHVIYEEKGIYNLIYELPTIIYSTIITIFINLISRELSLTQKNILNLKYEKKIKNLKIEMKKLISCLNKKFIIFFIITYLFLFLFWYYLSCFCAVYENTQIYIFKNTICSFVLSQFYYLVIYLFPGIFRIFSLNKVKKNRQCIYNFSKFLQLL